MKRLSLIFSAAVLSLSLAGQAVAATYVIDDAHSSVTFSIRHLVGRVTGSFTKFEGSFDYDEKNPKAWKTNATIQAASINTANEKRDAHLRTADFFDVEKFPTITFKSTGVMDVKGNTAMLHGDLTMHGVTKPVTLNLEIGGTIKDPWGKQRAGATAKGKINRKDFGIIYNKTMEAGGLMLGEDVDIALHVEGVLK